MSDGTVKTRTCEVAECYNQPQRNTRRCIFHPRVNLEAICKECEGDGCTLCTMFCGDCLTPLENCGCRP